MTNITDKCKQEAYKEANLLRKHLRTDFKNILIKYYKDNASGYYLGATEYKYAFLKNISPYLLLYRKEDTYLVRDLLLRVAKPYSNDLYWYSRCKGYFTFNVYSNRTRGQAQECSALEYYLHHINGIKRDRMWRFLLFNNNLELKDL